MKLEELEQVAIEKEAKAAANRAIADRWLGNHNLGADISKGWSYPCRNNCHGHCQALTTCTCPCHDDGMGHC
jgi:hypothetical protein